MNPSPYGRLKPLSLAVCLALPGSLWAAEAVTPATDSGTPETTAEDAPKLKTVVVTARRREEAAQDVPTPITTLTGANLDTQKVYRIQDLQQALPSVNVAYVHARVSSLAVRGIGNNPASDGLEGSAGVYLDNVYLGRPGMAAFDLLDIAARIAARPARYVVRQKHHGGCAEHHHPWPHLYSGKHL